MIQGRHGADGRTDGETHKDLYRTLPTLSRGIRNGCTHTMTHYYTGRRHALGVLLPSTRALSVAL